MSCNCKNNQKPKIPLPQINHGKEKSCSANKFAQNNIPLDKIQKNQDYVKHVAALCELCPHAKRNEKGNAVRCSLTNNTIPYIGMTHLDCPIGRFNSQNNVSKEYSSEWYGVSEISRWRLLFRLKRNPSLMGCGCHVKLKNSKLGQYLEPFLEGVSILRTKIGYFLVDLKSMEI